MKYSFESWFKNLMQIKTLQRFKIKHLKLSNEAMIAHKPTTYKAVQLVTQHDFNTKTLDKEGHFFNKRELS
jgi:hypothetical protein